MPEMQPQTSAFESQSITIFKPIPIIQTQEMMIEDNTIFRVMDCNADECSSPSIASANPISDSGDNFRVISPYPYSQSEVEIEERNSLTDDIVSYDWAMDEEEDSIDAQPIENMTALKAGQPTSLYSFYFETPSTDQECDDFTITSHDTASFADEGFCGLDNIIEDQTGFFLVARTCSISTQERLSPAQTCVSIDSAIELNRCDSLEK